MAVTVESLMVDVESNASGAVSGLEALAQTLTTIKSATSGGIGLKKIVKDLVSVSESAKLLDESGIAKIERLSRALTALQGIGNVKISASIGTGLRKIAESSALFTGVNPEIIEKTALSLAPFAQLGSIKLTTTINSLRKLPEVLMPLNKLDLTQAVSQLQKLNSQLIVMGNTVPSLNLKDLNQFAEMAKNLEKANAAMQKAQNASNGGARGLVAFTLKGYLSIAMLRKLSHAVSKCITTANMYIETLNLFTVAMGKGAQSAFEFGQKVSELMGIDIADWMRNQGVFQTIITGFGVASERANVMSKNLTQLGYDLSSFYNINVNDAMTKLQSGIAGELEPLRRIGYDLSQARLEAIALSLGIDKTYRSMTQAEKSQLRYYAIMTQVTQAQGDMARTLSAPANQLRVLTAQFTQLARAIGNLFIPALNAILPVAIAVVKVLRWVAENIARFFHVDIGEVDWSKPVEGLSSNMDSLGDNIDKSTKKVKKLKSALIGIDELNVIDFDDNDSNNNDTDTSTAFDFPLPEYDFLSGLIQSKSDEIAQMIEEALTKIEFVVSGFLLGVGAVLALTGTNIPLGVALMAIGAVGLAAAVALNWESLKENFTPVLSAIEAIIGGFLLALGALFALSGVDIPLGIAMMAAGAVTLVTAQALNWDKLSDETRMQIGVLNMIVGTGLFSWGVVLALTGQIPLGIGLMVAGAASMVASVALNWNALTGPMSGKIKTITALVSGGLLALGVVLLLLGVFSWGLGLIIAGCVGLYAAVQPDWDAILNAITETWDKVCTKTKEWWDDCVKWGQNIIDGIVKGIGDTWNNCVNGIIEFKNKFVKKFKELFGIHSPSTVFADIGGYLIDGLWNGISNAIGDVAGWFNRNLLQPIQNFFWNNPVSNLVSSWFGGANHLNTTLYVDVQPSSRSNGKLMHMLMADGGSISANGQYSSFGHIPHYAGGTAKASGSLFVAGEAGPEVVGHINGHSEVLNKSQLAFTMFESVSKAMGQYTEYFSSIRANQIAVGNALIQAIERISIDLPETPMPQIDTNQVTMESMYARNVPNSIHPDSELYVDVKAALADFYTEYMSQIMREIANDVKRQADKDDSPVVQIGADTLRKAVAKQSRADGYSFT